MNSDGPFDISKLGSIIMSNECPSLGADIIWVWTPSLKKEPLGPFVFYVKTSPAFVPWINAIIFFLLFNLMCAHCVRFCYLFVGFMLF